MHVLFLAQSCVAAAPPLAALLDAGYTVSAVILAGRPGEPGEPERLARQAGVPIVWVASVAEATAAMQAAPTAVAVAACFPWRLPAVALAIPPLGVLNVHPSLLPAGRGPEPIFWTLRRGERASGVTVHRMDTGLDTGPIVAQMVRDIPDGIRAPALEAALMAEGGRLLVDALPRLAAGTLEPRPQPDHGASYAPRPAAEDWTMMTSLPAAWAWRFARGVAPLGGPLRVIAGNEVIPVCDAVAWSPEERLPMRVIAEEDGTVRVRFSPGWVRFRLGTGRGWQGGGVARWQGDEPPATLPPSSGRHES
jgi:methionyl-tRNA formyltransferase